MSEAPILGTLSPRKDVDGLTIENFGKLMRGEPRYLPCTPAGVMRMLEHERIVVAGKRVAIVGRSLLVGRPLAMMLSAKGSGGDATVVLCHSRTENLADEIRRADVVIVATGLVDTVVGDMLKPGAVVIDVGINRRPDGKLVGDVNFESASKVASAITPVPGGVGPMTVAMLLENTLKAAWEQHRARGD
jgi:methylenetetrahydrofolate dehydrogenase (NADP+)/methenyltetrahydrofolate cyclohydrolase